MDNEISTVDPMKPASTLTDQKKDESRSECAKKAFICPYKECGKRFTESGNLKTHIRIHVLFITSQCLFTENRLARDHLNAATKAVARALSLRDT